MDQSTVSIIAIVIAIFAAVTGVVSLFITFKSHRLRLHEQRHRETAAVTADLHYVQHVHKPYPLLEVSVISTCDRVIHRLKAEFVARRARIAVHRRLHQPPSAVTQRERHRPRHTRGRDARQAQAPTVQMLEDRICFNAIEVDGDRPLYPREPRDFVMLMSPPLFSRRVWKNVRAEDVSVVISHAEGELLRIPGEVVMQHLHLSDDDGRVHEVKPTPPAGVTSLFRPAAESETPA